MAMPTVMYVFKAQLIKVVDGDTLDLDIDVGLHCHRIERVRLLGVNTPEMRGTTQLKGIAAKVFVERWLEGAALIVATYKSDAFGRFLADVWRSADGAHLNDDLLTSGNAVVFH